MPMQAREGQEKTNQHILPVFRDPGSQSLLNLFMKISTQRRVKGHAPKQMCKVNSSRLAEWTWSVMLKSGRDDERVHEESDDLLGSELLFRCLLNLYNKGNVN